MDTRKIYIKSAVIIVILILIFPKVLFAGPTSPNFELKSFGFGAGGIIDASSDLYKMAGIAGEQSGDPADSDSYQIQPGLNYTLQANLPSAPSLINPGSTYDRLKLIIDNGNNPSDTTFAVAISDDNWTTTRYVQSDFTPGATLESEDWQTYTNWGETDGVYITGLAESTTYFVKVKANQGVYTQSGWSSDDSAVTSVPSLTFGIDSATIAFDPLGSGNSFTDSSKATTLTTSTNAYYGYTVFGHYTGALTDTYLNTIDDFDGTNASPQPWSGIGFGYTSDDDDLIGGDPDRFTNGGPKYAKFTTSSPGDPVADHPGPIVEIPISNDEFNISYRITADQNTPAGTYTTTILYQIVPEY